MSAQAVVPHEAALDLVFRLVEDEIGKLVVRDIRKSHSIRHAARVRRGEVLPAEPAEEALLFGDGLEQQPPHRQFVLTLERIAKGA